MLCAQTQSVSLQVTLPTSNIKSNSICHVDTRLPPLLI